QIQTALHAAAEGLDAVGGAIREADELERRRDRLPQRLAGEIVQRAKETQVVACAELFVQRKILRHETDAALRRVGVAGKPSAADDDVAAVRRREAGNH